jgi:hypothetical protein
VVGEEPADCSGVVWGGVGEEGLGIELVQMANTNPSTSFFNLLEAKDKYVAPKGTHI